MRQLLLLGLNHTTAPIELRERLAVAPERVASLLNELKARLGGVEAVVLSTCNRVEYYIAAGEPGGSLRTGLTRFVAETHDVPEADFSTHLYERTDAAAVEHLFRVTCSLDSMVLGETQILGQVRQAYEAATAAGVAGPVLNPLFQRALAVGKQVIHSTGLVDGRTSVASVAVDYARRVFDRFDDKTVLCVGAGKIAHLALAAFSQLNPKAVLVCNRDPARAEKLAGQFGGTGLGLDQLDRTLASADVVITSTGSSRPVVSVGLIQSALRQRRYRPVLLMDLAVPRDVEPAVGGLENVYLYNLDDLQRVVAATHIERRDAVELADQIIRKHLGDYVASQRTREAGPLIAKLYKRYHDLASEELARTLTKLPGVSESELHHLEDLTRRIVNKLLHDPVQAMRLHGKDHGGPDPYLHALERLYKLIEEDPTDNAIDSANRGHSDAPRDGDLPNRPAGPDRADDPAGRA